MAAAKATIDHDTIRSWVEKRGGRPACVKGTGGDGDTGMLRIDFPGHSGDESLEPISWNEFFDAFDENDLAFLYQESVDSSTSRFSKVVDRNTVDVAD